jgi:excisionase family DNA binding protein
VGADGLGKKKKKKKKRIVMEVSTADSNPPLNGAWMPLLTPIECAELLRCHPKTTLKLAREHKLPAIRLGRHWRFRKCDLLAWIDSQIEDCE